MTQLGDILTGSGMIGVGAGMQAPSMIAFGGSTLLVAGVLALLGAQEAEKAAAWRIADIRAMQALLGDAAPAIGGDFSLSELDADWAMLSDALISHHADIEARGDRAADVAICAFYRESAARRELAWPM